MGIATGLIAALKAIFGIRDGEPVPKTKNIVVKATVFIGNDDPFVANANPKESTIELPVDSLGYRIGGFKDLFFIRLSFTGKKSIIQWSNVLHIPVNQLVVWNDRAGGYVLTSKVRHLRWLSGPKVIMDLNAKVISLGKIPFTGKSDTPGVMGYLAVRLIKLFLKDNVAKRLNVREDMIVSAHSGWVLSKDNLEINLLISPSFPNNPSRIARKMREDRLIFMRAGKDIWSQPLTEYFTGDFYVTNDLPKVGRNKSAAHDGDFAINPDLLPASFDEFKRSFGLVRGIVEEDGVTAIVKGRAILSRELAKHAPDGATIDFGTGVAGWITPDSIKWDKVEPGSIVRITLAICKDEDHPIRDAYKLHLMDLIIAPFNESVRSKIWKFAVANVRRTANKLSNITTHVDETMVDILAGDADNKRVAGNLLKYIHGLAVHDEIHEIEAAMIDRVKSLTIRDSMYAGIIYAEEYIGVPVHEGELLCNHALVKALEDKAGHVEWPSKPVLVLRSPVTGHQSYISLRLVTDVRLDDLDTPMCIAHPSDAKYMQGDGDDHVTIFPHLYTTFTGGEDPAVSRELPPDPVEPDTVYYYVKPTVSQRCTGVGFNAMIRTLAMMRAMKYPEAEVLAAEGYFGSILDAFVQGIKKHIALPDAIDLQDRVDALRRRWNKFTDEHKDANTFMVDWADMLTANPLTRMEVIRMAIKLTMKIDLPKLDPLPIKSEKIEIIDRKTAEAFVKRGLTLGDKIGPAIQWHNDLMTAAFGVPNLGMFKKGLINGTIVDEVAIRRGIDMYAWVAFVLKHRANLRKVNADMAMKQILGEFIYLSQYRREDWVYLTSLFNDVFFPRT